MILQEVCRTDRGLDIETELVETSDQRKRFFLIFVREGNNNGTIVLHLDAGCLKRLKERTVQALIVTDRLTGGLHLRREVSIHTVEFLE